MTVPMSNATEAFVGIRRFWAELELNSMIVPRSVRMSV
jgi:hypothetical protein